MKDVVKRLGRAVRRVIRMTGAARCLPLMALGLIVAGAAPAAAGAPQCGEREAIVAQLVDRYGETQRSVGLQTAGIVEIYANSHSGSWTILLTTPQGLSCLLASGHAWQALAPRRAETPA
jgi:hypothetical protein